jgi:hypothetical protein
MMMWPLLIPVTLVLVVFLYNGRNRQNYMNTEKAFLTLKIIK